MTNIQTATTLPMLWHHSKKANTEGKVSNIMGFLFNPEPVKSEVAQCQTIRDTADAILATGSEPDAEKS